jgi:APA family basic amino acid/polyamine antiporter
MASMAMSVYIGGPKYAALADNKHYLIPASLALLLIAAGLNLVGLNIGKWLQNAGGVSTYVPLMMIVGLGLVVWMKQGSVTTFNLHDMIPSFSLDTLNFWSSIAFAFTGMELIAMMSEEVRDPQKTFPRSIYISGTMIVAMYILGTVAVLAMVPADAVNTQNGVFQAIGIGSNVIGIAWFGVLANALRRHHCAGSAFSGDLAHRQCQRKDRRRLRDLDQRDANHLLHPLPLYVRRSDQVGLHQRPRT